MIEHKNILVSKRLVVLNSAASVLARIVNITAILWMYQYLLTRISAEEFAVYPLVIAIMFISPLFFSFFSGGISRYVVAAYAKGEFDRVTGIVSSVVPAIVAAAALFLIVGVLFAFSMETVFNIAPQMVDDARIMMLLLVTTFTLQMLGLPFGVGFHVRQRFVELSLLGTLRDFLRVALLFIFLLSIGPYVVLVVLASAISEIIYTLIIVIRSRQMVPELHFRRSLIDLKQARWLLSFGLWTTFGQLGYILTATGSIIVLNIFATATDVTVFHVAVTFLRQLDMTIGLACQPLQPVITAMHSLGDKQRLSATVRRGGRYGLWVALAIATPLAIHASEFVQLYLEQEYSSAATVIILLMLVFPFSQPTVLLAMTAMAMAQVRAFFLPAFLFQGGGIVLMLVLTAWSGMGAGGVALSLLLTIATAQIFYFWPLCLKLAEIPFAEFIREVLVPGFRPALVAALVWGALKLAAPPDSWLALGLHAAAGGAVYLAVLFGWCLNAGEKRDLHTVLRRIPGWA